MRPEYWTNSLHLLWAKIMELNKSYSKKKYTIAFLMSGAKSPRGGEILLSHCIKHLKRDVLHPIVIYAEEGVIVREIKKAGIDAIRIPLNNKITTPFLKNVLYNPIKLTILLMNFLKSMYIFKVMRVLREYNVDLICSADTLSKIVGGISGKCLGIKVVAHCHADYSSIMFQNIIGRLLKMIDSFLLDAILAVSEKVRSCFKGNDRVYSKVITVYNGVDAEFFNPIKVADSLLKELGGRYQIIIGNIGALDKFKGQIYLLEAIKRLKEEGIANILCLFCGTGKEEEFLRKFVEGNDLKNEVLFLGFCDDILRVLKILDILVITSLAESFSMAAVEAMAMRVPVIATNIGGIPEVIDDGKTGIVIPPGNVDAICKAIKYLIQNPGVRIQMGKNGRARVLEKFTIEQNVRKTEDIFLSLMVS